MAKYDPHFQLKEPNSNKKTDIRLRLGYDYIDFTWYLKDSLGRIQKIYPVLWDSKEQQPISKVKIPKKYENETFNLQIIKTTIDNVKLIVNQIINESIINKTKITKEYLKQEIEVRLGLQKRKKGMTVYDFCLQIVKEMEAGTVKTENGTIYEKGSIKHFKGLSVYLHFFKPETQFFEINDVWYRDFVSFCQNKQEIKDSDGNIIFEKKDCENSYVGAKVKKLKRLMDLAIEKKVSSNNIHREKWFKVLKNQHKISKTDVYLSEKEIKTIYDYIPQDDVIIIKEKVNKKTKKIIVEKEKINKDTLLKAKDLFLLGCYTGLRVSDFNSRLSKDNFRTTAKGNPVLVKINKKTKDSVTIPIHWIELIYLAEKYNYTFPEMTDTRINIYIKEVCKSIGFSEMIEFYTGKGGHQILHKEEKWKLISTHTGRRSAVTNLSLKGLSESDIGRFTGHRADSMVAKYNKASTEDTADMLMEKLKNK